MRTFRYNPALDGLRAIAVLAVLAYHLGVLPGGFLGVDVFLVLSGFLITTLMLDERESTGVISIRAFYLRRVYRLMPAFYLFVAVGAGLVVALKGRTQQQDFFENALTSLLYVNNYYRLSHQDVSSWFGHAWSLSLEEQFYIVWPLCMLALSRTSSQRARLPLILSASIAALAAWRLSLIALGASQARIHFSLDTRCDELLIGCALASFRHLGFTLASAPRANADDKLLQAVVKAGPAALGLLVAATFLPLERTGQVYVMELGGYTVAALLSAIVVLSLDQGQGRFKQLLASRPLSGLGRISYGFYLWHYPVAALVHAQLFKRVGSVVSVLTAFTISYGLALASYRFVEQPFQRLRSRNARKSADEDLSVSVSRISDADL
ncbi:MAG: putative rane-bound acyl-transferase [Myxococcaceae bacterium]|nr:putative rane-bound acyl-transferase [Myxococcaceae bacterium]